MRSLRWTTWNEKRSYGCSEEYREAKLRSLVAGQEAADRPHDTARDESYCHQCEIRSWFGDDFYYLLGPPHQSLMGVWAKVEMEPFSYYLYDCEDIVVEQLEWNTAWPEEAQNRAE
ncbi:MAG: hypothetical protein ACE149_07540 [Armatimonadota bacterium]